MQGLAWISVFVAIGIAAGSGLFALTPARYRAITALQVTVTHNGRFEALPEPSDDQFAELMRRVFPGDWIESLMEEHGLYRAERQAGRWPDALLSFRRSLVFSRHVESETSERWTVAFEAADPDVAQTVCSKLASVIVESLGSHKADDDDGDSAEALGLRLMLNALRDRIRAVDSEISTWKRTHHGANPPAALTERYEALFAEYIDLLKQERPAPPILLIHSVHPFSLAIEVVKTPRVFDGRVGPRFLPFAATGAAAGLVLGVFTMPPFIWWRRHSL